MSCGQRKERIRIQERERERERPSAEVAHSLG